MPSLTPDLLAKFAAGFHADAANAIRQRAVVKMGIDAAAENHRAEIECPMVFSLELKDTGKVTDQKASGRCWLFAALGTMRYEVIHRLDLDDFELSQNYLMFWDKLEKANAFLDSMVEFAGEPTDSRPVTFLMARSARDGGQWDMYAALADKYGCVPKSTMPETFHSSNSAEMNRLLSRKLAEDTAELRAAGRGGAPAGEIAALKGRMLQEIYTFLAICLGEPPAKFDFEYRGKDGGFHRDAGLTPKTFFRKYVGLRLSDYVSVVNAPTADKPFGKTYTIAHMGNVIGGRPIKYLNLPFADLRQLALAQLADGKPVWFGCDFGQMCLRDKGHMTAGTFDYKAATGLDFAFCKNRRIDYRMVESTHAMVLLGVNLADGKTNRWKVENSFGKESGRDGYFVMTDDWFAEYGFQLVVDKKHFTPAQRKAFRQPPVILAPWDTLRDTL